MKLYSHFYKKYDMICVSRITLNFFGGVREYLNHINALLDASYVCMEYKKEIYIVPVCYALKVFSKGGVFVNE